ncbi:acetamidase/formamidase family protein [Bifidobacterium aquikefiricola]|uniref:Acetamidase/formamidase family protein n=1 Tax=Bifidobacterium aquikefiricola TaxID=3059038 RepID=A0AB39U826_9BIFI
MQKFERTGTIFTITSSPESVLWGVLPSQRDEPLCTVDSGSIVTIDTLSHEGVLEDQGSDPIAFFGAQGIDADQVLPDAVNLVNNVPHIKGAGPHIVNRRIDIANAHAGDYLKVEVLQLTPRVPYGIISNRHGKGVLTRRFPQGKPTVSVFAQQITRNGAMWGVIDKTGPDALARYENRLKQSDPLDDAIVQADSIGEGGANATLPLANTSLSFAGGQRDSSDGQAERIAFPLAPFLGIMGVTPATDEHLSTVPPGDFGGNLDINLLVSGSTLYLPIQVEGAGFYVGDPHFVQGNGEVSLTALEASLHAQLKLTVIPRVTFKAHVGALEGPMIETPDYWVTTGRALTLDEALEHCVTETITALNHLYAMDDAHAYALASACIDFNISEAVDIVKGVHACIPKSLCPMQ